MANALKRRRSLTIWFDPDMIWAAMPTGKRGRQPVCSDAAVQTCLTMKVLFGMALRQTTGFVESLISLVGLDWDVPDFSTLSRRQKILAANIPHRGAQGRLHLSIDSTGIKVEGEGEWNARKHGGTKRRVWRKIHIAIDERTPEIRAAGFTTSDVGDAPVLPELLNQIPADQEIASVTAPSHGSRANRCRAANGACDTRKCHDAIHCPAVHVYMHERGRTGRCSRHSAAQERQAVEGRHCGCGCAQRGPAGVEIPRPHPLATGKAAGSSR